MFTQALRLLSVLLIAVSLSLPAQAGKLHLQEKMLFAEPGQSERHEAKKKVRIISPQEAARRARNEYPGKVLSVKLRGGGDFYAVKIIQDGRVRVVRVPAER